MVWYVHCYPVLGIPLCFDLTSYGLWVEQQLEPADQMITGIPKIMASSRTIKTEVVSSKPDEIIFKLQQEYMPKPLPVAKKVNSLVTLTLDKNGRVKYHKDMWNEKDYSHGGLGMVFKTLNGDHLTKITQPPESL